MTLPNVVTLAKAINQTRANEGREQEDLQGLVNRARLRFKREFRDEGDLSWALWNYLSKAGKDWIYNNLDEDHRHALEKEADICACLSRDVNPYFHLEATNSQKLDLTFPDTSRKVFNHYLRHLPSLTALIALKTNDDTKHHVEDEVKKLISGLRASGRQRVDERDIKVLAYEDLNEEQRKEWKTQVPEPLQGLNLEINPYVLPEGLEKEEDIFVVDRILPAIQSSNLPILNDAPDVFVTMPPTNTKANDENDDAASRQGEGADTENGEDDIDLAKGGRFEHRYDSAIWTPGMPEATAPTKPGPGKKNKQTAYEHFPLYMEWLEPNKDNLPPTNVRLSDWHVFKILEIKINGRKRCERWPADFTSDREVRKDRPPHGWPAKGNATSEDGRSVFQYMMYRGYYVLCGDEGAVHGVKHIVDKDPGPKLNAFLSLSGIQAINQRIEGPKKRAPTSQAPKTPTPKPNINPANPGSKFTAINKQQSSPIPPTIPQDPRTPTVEMPWDTELRSVRTTSSTQKDPEHNEAYLAAIQRGDRLRDLTTEAMMSMMDANSKKKRNYSELTARIERVEHELGELRLQRDRIYDSETVDLMSIPKQFTSGLKGSGLDADFHEFTTKVHQWKPPGKRAAED